MVHYYADENLKLVREPVTQEDLCAWASDFHKRYFSGGPAPDIKIALNTNLDFRWPGAFDPTDMTIHISERLAPFHELAKISLLHEMIHVKLYLENRDADIKHGARFRAEQRRLMEKERAYDELL